MKDINFYLKQRYSIEIKCYPDGMFCAEIAEIPGLCGYGTTEIDALQELDLVKRTAFELMLSQGKSIPLPMLRFNIPVDEFEKFPFKDELERYALV